MACFATISLAATLTAAAIISSVIPNYVTSPELAPFGIFYLLASERFALLLSAPYLCIASLVTACDFTSLTVAVKKGKVKRVSSNSKSRSKDATTSSSLSTKKSILEEKESSAQKKVSTV